MKKTDKWLTDKQAKNIASILNVKPKEVIEMDGRLNYQDYTLNYIEDNTTNPADIYEYTDYISKITIAFKTLSTKELHVLNDYYINESISLQQITDELQVSKQYIYQIKEKSLQKLRNVL